MVRNKKGDAMRRRWGVLGAVCVLAVLLCGCATMGPLVGAPKSPFAGEWVAESVPTGLGGDDVKSLSCFIAGDGSLSLAGHDKDGNIVASGTAEWKAKGTESIAAEGLIGGEKCSGTAQLIGNDRMLLVLHQDGGGDSLAGYFRKKGDLTKSPFVGTWTASVPETRYEGGKILTSWTVVIAGDGQFSLTGNDKDGNPVDAGSGTWMPKSEKTVLLRITSDGEVGSAQFLDRDRMQFVVGSWAVILKRK